MLFPVKIGATIGATAIGSAVTAVLLPAVGIAALGSVGFTTSGVAAGE